MIACVEKIPLIYEMVSFHRKMDCSNYNKCLSAACYFNWPSFSCSSCEEEEDFSDEMKKELEIRTSVPVFSSESLSFPPFRMEDYCVLLVPDQLMWVLLAYPEFFSYIDPGERKRLTAFLSRNGIRAKFDRFAKDILEEFKIAKKNGEPVPSFASFAYKLARDANVRPSTVFRSFYKQAHTYAQIINL